MADDELKRVLEGIRQENAAAQAETRRHFDVAVERLEHRFDTLAEGIASVDEKVERRMSELEDRIERGFAETQAMIKFSHAELDRRVRALEDAQRTIEQTLTEVQARLERLESSPH